MRAGWQGERRPTWPRWGWAASWPPADHSTQEGGGWAAAHRAPSLWILRIARVTAGDGSTWIARVESDFAVPVLPDPDGAGQDALRDALADGVDLAGLAPAEEPRPLAGWRLRAPVSSPQKVLAIGLNYADHAREAGVDPPQAPVTLVKTTNSVIGPGEAIRYHREDSTQVDYEAELAVVVGRRARRVGEGEALSHVFGYTACNDVSARDAQSADGQWVRAKSFDTFCPLGPWVVTADQVGDVQSLAIRCRVNGEVLQDGTTAEMIFPVAHLVSYLSQVMTLEPGDVISTGTPSGVGFARRPPRYLQDGDVVEVEVERVGVLRNPVQVE